MEIVIPLLLEDLDRYLRAQRPTFETCYRDLATTTIVTRPGDVAEVRSQTSELDGVIVMDETELVPELRVLRRVRKPKAGRDWHAQQLVKLAAVAHARTEHVLVLDADVIAARPVGDSDLITDERALRPREPTSRHSNWVQWAGDALGVEPLHYAASVTPSVLSRSAVRLLADHLEQHIAPKRRAVRAVMSVPVLGRSFRSWRGRLLGLQPWTEYQLYDTFLVRTGRFDDFHFDDPNRAIYGNSVWYEGEFERWRPDAAGQSDYYFSVIQSYLGVPIDDIVEKLCSAGLIQTPRVA
jgi:hypothetical protein